MTVSSEAGRTRDYTVRGMTCGHCVTSVREEVGEVSGVSAVEVDLAPRRHARAGARLPR